MYIHTILILFLCVQASAQLRGVKRHGQLSADILGKEFNSRGVPTQQARMQLQAEYAATVAASKDQNYTRDDDDDDDEGSDQSEVLVINIHIHERPILLAAGNFTLPGQPDVWYVLRSPSDVLHAMPHVLTSPVHTPFTLISFQG